MVDSLATDAMSKSRSQPSFVESTQVGGVANLVSLSCAAASRISIYNVVDA